MDMATLYRTGARFGPRAIRDASGQLRPHHWEPDKLEPPFDTLRIIDYGDLDVFPGYIEQSVAHLQKELAPIVEAGVFPVVLGGDHSTSLPVLRACAEKHGKLSLVHFDAHPDFWHPAAPDRPIHHGTIFRLASEEGLIDPRLRADRHPRLAFVRIDRRSPRSRLPRDHRRGVRRIKASRRR